MINRKTGLSLCCLFFLAIAGRAAEYDFTAGKLPLPWGVQRGGEAAGIDSWEVGKPALLAMPTGRSSLFLYCNIPAEQLQKGRHVRFQAWVWTETPQQVSMLLREGRDGWFGACSHYAVGQVPATPGWKRAAVEITAESTSAKICAVLGLDFQMEGGYVLIDSATVEVSDSPEFPPSKDTMPSYVPKLPEQITAWDHREQELIWQAADPLADVTANTIITGADTTEIAMQLPGNARDGMVMLLRNNSNRQHGFTLKLDAKAKKIARVYQLESVIDTPDKPALLTPDRIVTVGRQATAAFLVEFDTAKLSAGDYTGILTLSPVNGRYREREVQLKLHVARTSLPEEMPLAVFHYDYNSATDVSRLKALLDARVNVFHLADYTPERFTKMVQLLAEHGRRPGAYRIMIEDWHLREKNRFDESDKKWLDSIVAQAQALGLRYEDWFLHIYDEVLSPEFLAVAKAVKAYNPEIRIFSDCLDRSAKKMADFAPVVDFWSPLVRTLPPFTSDYEQSWKFIRDTKKPIWIYSCNPEASLAPAEFRLQSILAWRYRLDGNCLWSVLSVALRNTPGKPNFGLVYTDATSKIQPSRRWMQWRAGLEDYLLLVEAEKKLGRIAVESLADEVIAAYNSPQAGAKILALRERLLRALEGKNEAEFAQ